MIPRVASNPALYQSNDAHLAMLATQGNEQLTQAALSEMMAAQQAMQQVGAQQNLEVPKKTLWRIMLDLADYAKRESKFDSAR